MSEVSKPNEPSFFDPHGQWISYGKAKKESSPFVCLYYF